MEGIYPAKLHRYEILRLLYRSDKTLRDLRDRVSMKDKELIREIGYLLKASCIKRTVIHTEIEPSEVSDITMAADVLGVRPKSEVKDTKYHLTKRGIQKLAYWEWVDELNLHVALPVLVGDDERYFAEINQIIENENYFGHPR